VEDTRLSACGKETGAVLRMCMCSWLKCSWTRSLTNELFDTSTTSRQTTGWRTSHGELTPTTRGTELLTLIVDADVEAYYIAHSCSTKIEWDNGVTTESQEDDWEARLRERMAGYMERFEADSMFVALSDKENWRKKVLPSYKENRDISARPELWSKVRDLLELEYNGIVLPTLEGDDIMGLACTTDHWFTGTRIMISIDKDMRSVPGFLWDPMHPEQRPVLATARRAAYCLAFQSLVGDRVDNYFGLPGVGPAAAVDILEGCMTVPNYQKALWAAVVDAYEEEGLEEGDALVQTACARILQADDYDFDNGEVKVWQ
jgi:DNA polymerase-1